MLDDLYPGARLVSTRRLRGGLSAQVHAARIEFADGNRRTFVVRRKANGADRIPRHFRTLEVLAGTAAPAPKPVLLDMAGRYFDVPSMVIEHAGYPLLTPGNQTSWLAQLAAAIHRVHQVTPENADLSHLARPLPGYPAGQPEEPDPFLEEMRETLARNSDRFEPLPQSLVHDDYWPGNTVWLRQRLTAIIDWDGATIGDRRTDIAQCRMDLALIAGEAAADGFLREYEALDGAPLDSMWYFDLECVSKNYTWFERWLTGYRDIGIDWVTPESMAAAARAFAERALAGAP